MTASLAKNPVHTNFYSPTGDNKAKFHKGKKERKVLAQFGREEGEVQKAESSQFQKIVKNQVLSKCWTNG